MLLTICFVWMGFDWLPVAEWSRVVVRGVIRLLSVSRSAELNVTSDWIL